MVSSGFGYISRGGPGEAIDSNGAVKVDGVNSTWTIASPCGASARLFVGGTGTTQGGTALLNLTNNGAVVVNNPANQIAVKVGISGTLTGSGTIQSNGVTYLGALTAVQGTLAPIGTLKINEHLGLSSSAAMICNVIPAGADSVSVSQTAALNGRLSVTMTGTFTPGTRFTLLHAEGGRIPNTTFSQGVSINYPTSQGFEPRITYDTKDVYLDLLSNH